MLHHVLSELYSVVAARDNSSFRQQDLHLLYSNIALDFDLYFLRLKPTVYIQKERRHEYVREESNIPFLFCYIIHRLPDRRRGLAFSLRYYLFLDLECENTRNRITFKNVAESFFHLQNWLPSLSSFRCCNTPSSLLSAFAISART
jgi:hypothetical protein